MWELIWIAALGIIAGVSIGCIGVGGVILVPALVFLAGIPIQIGISAAMFAYILSGLVGTAVFARHKSIQWSMAIWLCVGATPAAFAGAWAVSVVNPRLLEIVLGLLVFLSGLNSLRKQRSVAATLSAASAHTTSNTVLGVVGAITGFLSSVTGTGGPVVLVPILISMSMPVLTAVGLSQAIQLPVAIAATVGNVLYGEFDLMLGAVLAATLTVGSWYGAKLAHAVPRSVLQRLVSGVLVIVGLFILGNIIWRLLG